MKLLSKCIAGLLVFSIIALNLPKISFCGDLGLFAKADQKKITRHQPEIMSMPEKDIPLAAAAADTGEKKKPNWLLIGAATVLVIGLAAMAGGGGDPDPDTGSVTAEW